VQSAGGTPAPFRKLLIDDIAPVAQVIDCEPLDYDVRAADSFAELSTTLATDGSGRMIDTVFQPGTRKQAVLVQVGCYRPWGFPAIGRMLTGRDGMLLTSSVAFRNEPYR
jgi:hypothetical protein